MSAELFNLYLHQNYLDFFSSVEDVARASEYLSDADFFTGDWAVSLQNTPEPWTCGTGIVLYTLCCMRTTNSTRGKWSNILFYSTQKVTPMCFFLFFFGIIHVHAESEGILII